MSDQFYSVESIEPDPDHAAEINEDIENNDSLVPFKEFDQEILVKKEKYKRLIECSKVEAKKKIWYEQMEITRDVRELRKNLTLVMMLFGGAWALCRWSGSESNSYTKYH